MTNSDRQYLLETVDLGKTYGGIRVLGGISVHLSAGKITGLIGENGAGKSTFTKCINGTVQPSDGAIYYDGRLLKGITRRSALDAGIITIPQEFNLVQDLKVYENIFLGRELKTRLGLLDSRRMIAESEEYLGRLEFSLDPRLEVSSLSVAQRQMVEIAKAISQRCRLLIMDEPSTVLNSEEVSLLFKVMRRLREEGTAILYISHKLHEVREICDDFIVFRDGSLISQEPVAGISEREMAVRMVGRELHQMHPPKVPVAKDAPPVLEVSHLSSGRVVRDVSFTLRAGEILGFAGLVGAGRTELAECLYGIRRTDRGEIRLKGRRVRFRNPAEAVQAGLAYLSEDRQGTGILTEFPVRVNTTLVSLAKYCHPLISGREEREKSREYIDRFRIKTNGTETLLRQLSGGNQQKVAIAKGLDSAPDIFIFDEPTRGIDINAKCEVYAFIAELLKKGIACILISSDLEEILGMCSRVAVMREGTLAGFAEGDRLNEEQIMFLATGVKE